MNGLEMKDEILRSSNEGENGKWEMVLRIDHCSSTNIVRMKRDNTIIRE